MSVASADAAAPQVTLLQLEDTTYRGWLYKQGRYFKTWKRRFFVLKDGALFYYKDEKVSVAVPRAASSDPLLRADTHLSPSLVPLSPCRISSRAAIACLCTRPRHSLLIKSMA